MPKMTPITAMLLLLWAVDAARAQDGPDTLILEDGRTLTGTVLEENAAGVKFKMKFAITTFSKKEIKSVQRGGKGAAHAGDLRDVLVMKNGDRLQGVLVKENPRDVVFDVIASGANVSRTMLVRSTYQQSEIQEIRKLTGEQRAGVLAYLAKVKSQARQEKDSIEAVEVKDHTWANRDPKGPPIPAGLVELDHFIIESTTPREFFRECAFRLAKVYSEYRKHFGSEEKSTKKVTVKIYDSMDQYYGSTDHLCKNPAFYMPALNLVCAGCEYHRYKRATDHMHTEFARLRTLLEERKQELVTVRGRLNRQVGEINRRIRSAHADPNAKQAALQNLRSAQIRVQMELGKYQQEVDHVEKQMADFKRRLAVAFDKYTHHMFAVMYHECFHAFLQNFLFDKERVEKVPLWLNEGLAQYFELARIEGGRMILGREDRHRMALLRKWNKEGGLVELEKLIVADSKHFIFKDTSEIEQSTKHYLQSWFIVHWLGQKNRLSRKILTDYVDALKAGKPPVEALPILTGVSNGELQKVMDEKFKYDFTIKGK